MELLIKRVAEELLASQKLDESLLPTVERYVRRTVNRVLIFCGREDIPEALELLVTEIAEEMLRADGVITRPEEVSSVSRGDTTIHYRDKSSAYQKADVFLKDYEGLLRRYKKMNLPRELS